MLLQATTGFENFPDRSARVGAYWMPTKQFPGGKELSLGVAARASMGISKLGASRVVPCAPGFRPEFGEWSTSSYQLPDGMLIKLFASRSLGGFGASRQMANMILRCRDTGPLQRVMVRLSEYHAATLTRATFEGRFDILTVGEAEGLGAKVATAFLPQFDGRRVSEMFEMVRMEEETAPRVTVTTRRVRTAEGMVSIPHTAPARRLDI